MASAAQYFFNQYIADLHNKVHNIGSDALKLALSNTAPTATITDLSGITQIAAGGGYTLGGFPLIVTSSTQTSGVYKATITNYSFSPTGTVATFRYPILYNSTAGNKTICWWDYGVGQDLLNGDTFNFNFDSTLGALRGSFAP
jgi:hypothetical protein